VLTSDQGPGFTRTTTIPVSLRALAPTPSPNATFTGTRGWESRSSAEPLRAAVHTVLAQAEAEQAGVAGAVADAISLFDKLDSQLERSAGNLRKAAVELTKDWRTDRILRRLEAQLVVADASLMPTITSSNTNLPSLMIGERFGAWLRG